MRKATTKHPVRIAFVSDAIYPYNKGGKETRLYNITTRLAKLGVDVHVYTMKWWHGENVRREDGVTLHAICPKLSLYSGERRSIAQGIVFGLSCFRLMFESFDVVDVDHMPFFPLYSMRVVCWLKGKKMFATWHEVWGVEYWRQYLSGIKGTIAGVIERWSFSLPDMIVSVSEMTTQRLRKQGCTQLIVTIPNGIDIESIRHTRASKMTSDIIYAGRLLKHKNIDVLLRAVKIMKESHPMIRCMIIGEGPELDNLQELTKDLELKENVIFLPFQNPIEKLYGLVKSSKVFVLPSAREGFGLVILEANACGIPVVTVDLPDNAAKSLVHASNGLISSLSPNALSEACLQIINSTKTGLVEVPSVYAWQTAVTKYTKSFQI